VELQIFFNSLDLNLFQENKLDSLGAQVVGYQDTFPDWRSYSLAIFGVEEERGATLNKGTGKGPNEIRKKLYSLKKINSSVQLVDLGNLRAGVTIEETYLRVKEVCEVLITHQVIPIILGGSHDLDYGQYMAYENLSQLVNIVNVDAFLDLEQDDVNKHLTHTYKILTHQPNYLFNFSQIGYQAYLNSDIEILSLEKFYFDCWRLGKVRESISKLEPVLRDADMVSFDVTAIKMADAPGNQRAQPFGLTGEEACQLAWYAGISDRITSIGFYEYNPEIDHREQTSSVVATMVWYFIEGFHKRKGEKNFESASFFQYKVDFPDHAIQLCFYKSKVSEKWWMESPILSASKKIIIACDYEDYQLATQGILPERWVMLQSKFG